MTRTVFTIDDSLLLNAVPFAGPHRLVELNRWGPSGDGPSQPVAIVENWRNERTLFERVETYARVEGRLRRRCRAGDPAGRGRAAQVSPGMFALLGIAPGLGRTFAPNEAGSPVAIVSHGAWADPFRRGRGHRRSPVAPRRARAHPTRAPPRVVCGRGRNTTPSVSRRPARSAPGQQYSPTRSVRKYTVTVCSRRLPARPRGPAGLR